MSCGCSSNSYGAYGAAPTPTAYQYAVPGSIEYEKYQYAAYYASMAQAMREVRAEEAAKQAQEAALLTAQSDSAVQPLPMRLVAAAIERPWIPLSVGLVALVLVLRR
jgi:hypothetical protein